MNVTLFHHCAPATMVRCMLSEAGELCFCHLSGAGARGACLALLFHSPAVKAASARRKQARAAGGAAPPSAALLRRRAWTRRRRRRHHFCKLSRGIRISACAAGRLPLGSGMLLRGRRAAAATPRAAGSLYRAGDAGVAGRAVAGATGYRTAPVLPLRSAASARGAVSHSPHRRCRTSGARILARKPFCGGMLTSARMVGFSRTCG